jgi:hypothetical protein
MSIKKGFALLAVPVPVAVKQYFVHKAAHAVTSAASEARRVLTDHVAEQQDAKERKGRR